MHEIGPLIFCSADTYEIMASNIAQLLVTLKVIHIINFKRFQKQYFVDLLL